MTLLLDAGAPELAPARPARAAAVDQAPLFPAAPDPPRTVAAPPAPERPRTLDDALAATWQHLTAGASSAACPVCDGELAPRWSAGAGVVGGRCRDCGTELA